MPLDTKAAIIDAAIRLISERGFDRISTRDLAKAVGIASPSLYKHFASMAEITAEALKVVTERRAEAYRRVLTEHGEPRELLKQIAVILISGFLENPTLIHVYQQVMTPQAGSAIDMIASLWDRDLFPRFLAVIKNVDPDSDPSFAYFVLFSFSLGAAMYLPTHERRGPLSDLDRSPLRLAERGLTAALPRIDWRRVAPISTSSTLDIQRSDKASKRRGRRSLASRVL